MTSMLERVELKPSRLYAENTCDELKQKVEALEQETCERRRAEQYLRESEERLKTILDTVQAGIVVVDPLRQIIVGINSAASRMLEISRRDILGTRCYDYMWCSTTRGHCPVVESDEDLGTTESVLTTVKGKKIPVIKSVAHVTLEGRDHLVESFLDITSHKRAEKERMERQKLEGVLEMAGAICHELNQPMQALFGYCSFLSRGIPEGSGMHKYVEKIEKQVDRVGEITRKLMGITRYETKDYAEGGRIIDIDKAADPR